MISIVQVVCALLLAILTSAQNNNPNCADAPPAATVETRSFDILKTDGNIETTVQCSWTLTAPAQQVIMVYVTVGTSTENQCVKVEDTIASNVQDICGRQGMNSFTSTGSSVTVSYPQNAGASASVPNFKVMYKIATNENCADAPSEATAEEKSFSILKSGESIAPSVKCMWTITAPAQQKILVYLTVGSTGTDKQCIRVQDTGASNAKDICGKEGENNFTSTSQSVAVSYPKSTGVTEQVPNFKVMYRIANNENCADQPPQATDQEQSFNVLKSGETIGTDVKCSWNIMAPDSKNITVYLTVEGTSTEKQCVHVMDTGATTGKDICGVQDMNTFTSTSQSVKVSYPKKTGSPEQVSNFKVMYMIAGARRFAPWITAMSSVFILSQILLP